MVRNEGELFDYICNVFALWCQGQSVHRVKMISGKIITRLWFDFRGQEKLSVDYLIVQYISYHLCYSQSVWYLCSSVDQVICHGGDICWWRKFVSFVLFSGKMICISQLHAHFSWLYLWVLQPTKSMAGISANDEKWKGCRTHLKVVRNKPAKLRAFLLRV